MTAEHRHGSGQADAHGYGHGHGRSRSVDRSRVLVALCLTGGFMVVEIIGGLLSGPPAFAD